MPAILHLVDGPDAGRLFTIATDVMTIGRNAENTITLNDTGVSGTHTKIVRDEAGQFTLHDVSSTNGTFHTGKEIRAVDLKHGDRIRIGSTTLAFEVQGEPTRRIGKGILDDEGAVQASSSKVEAQTTLTLPGLDVSRLTREELERGYLRGLLLDHLDRALSELTGGNEILGTVLDAAMAATFARRGLILLVDERSGEMVPGVGRNQIAADEEVTFSKSLAFEVAASGKGFRGETGAGDEARAVICVPFRTTSTAVGLIYLHSRVDDAPFEAHDLNVVESIGRRAGVKVSASRWQVDFELLFSSMVDAIMNTIQAKDVYTRGHSERVRHYSKLLGKELGLSHEELYRLTLGAALHDIGKVGMPDSVLKYNKNARLTPEQMAEVRKHPERGAKILGDITFLKDIIPAAEMHHEDWDGGGYPHGLKGEEIPLFARIVAVADTYDAITTDRPYQKGKSYEEGHAILRKISGKRLEPDLVELFITGWQKHRKSPTKAPNKATRIAGIEIIDSDRSALVPPDAPQDFDPDIDDKLSQIIEIG